MTLYQAPAPEINSALLDAIYQRRATRAYSAKPVSRELVSKLLDAAIQAPSAMNRQPWAFVVIQDRSLLTRISDCAKKQFLAETTLAGELERGHIPLDDPAFDIFYGGSTLVVICKHDEEGFSPEGDCFLAGQNLMLAAEALGLASCPIGFARDVLQTPAFREELSIPGEYWPVLPILVGYPKSSAPATQRKPAKVLAWR